RQLIEQVIAEVSKIIRHLHPSGAVAPKVVEKIEEGEDLEKQDEAHEQQHKVEEEIAKQIVIQDLRKPADVTPVRRALENRREIRSPDCGFMFLLRFWLWLRLSPPMHQPGERFAQPGFATQPFHRRQQSNAGGGHEDIRG